MAKKMPGQLIDWLTDRPETNGNGHLARNASSAHVVSLPAQRKFHLGPVLVIKNACLLDPDDVFSALRRHCTGDWGNLDDEAREANERALNDGRPLLSVYRTRDGVEFWIITDPAISITVVILPNDY